MKKTFYLLAAVVAMAACNQQDEVTNQTLSQSSESGVSQYTETPETILPPYTMQLVKAKSSKPGIKLEIDAAEADRYDVWIDLNNNKVKDQGEDIKSFQPNSSNSRPDTYIADADTITIYGKVTYLSCGQNNLVALDASHNPYLEQLRCNHNQLSELSLRNNRHLKFLDAGANSISRLDIAANEELESAWLNGNQLEALDITPNKALKVLNISANNIRSFSPEARPELTHLYINSNPISSLDVSKNTELETLECGSANLTALNVTTLKQLKWLHCSNNRLRTLDLSANTSLETLNCRANALTTLNLKNNSQLVSLHCEQNQLSTLNLSAQDKIMFIGCAENQMTPKGLNDLFSSLRSVVGITAQYSFDKQIDISLNPGISYAKLDIATNKGWKLVTDNKGINEPVN